MTDDMRAPIIDYAKMAAAQEYYRGLGYEELAAPWLVSEGAQNLGRPSDRRSLRTVLGCLPASGEQSLLDMMWNGQDVGRAFCITPCFRDEDREDDLHYRYFLKLELIDARRPVTEQLALDLRTHAAAFLNRYLGRPCAAVYTDEGWDLLTADCEVELGSYGIRETHAGRRWAYGTGLALPRLDAALARGY